MFNALKSLYGNYFDFPKLKSKLSIVYSSNQFHNKNINDFLDNLRLNDLESTLREVTKLAILILTISTTSALAERSFSALKRIKTYLKNNQNQKRLSDLSLLSIEKELLFTFSPLTK